MQRLPSYWTYEDEQKLSVIWKGSEECQNCCRHTPGNEFLFLNWHFFADIVASLRWHLQCLLANVIFTDAHTHTHVAYILFRRFSCGFSKFFAWITTHAWTKTRTLIHNSLYFITARDILLRVEIKSIYLIYLLDLESLSILIDCILLFSLFKIVFIFMRYTNM